MLFGIFTRYIENKSTRPMISVGNIEIHSMYIIILPNLVRLRYYTIKKVRGRKRIEKWHNCWIIEINNFRCTVCYGRYFIPSSGWKVLHVHAFFTRYPNNAHNLLGNVPLYFAMFFTPFYYSILLHIYPVRSFE